MRFESKVAFAVIFSACFTLVIASFSQVPVSTADAEKQRAEMQKLRDEAVEQQQKDMQELENQRLSGQRRIRHDIGMDKETRDRIAELRRPAREDLGAYQNFLKSKNTGIFKIYPKKDCLTVSVIRVDGDCAGYVPDNSDYSLFKRDYADPIFHDIEFNKDEIVSRGFFSQGVFVSMGDVPIGEVGAERDELKFFSRLKPSTSFVDAKKAALMFEGGIDDNGYRYANHIKVRENTTYGFRVIAYNGPTIVFTVMKHEPELSAETKFRILRYQPRGDRMVVFRIIRQDEDGAITILWKELDRQKAPKIEFAKGEKLADIRK